MSGLDIQQALLADFRTSIEADRLGDELRRALGLSTLYNIARLAIGRSLGHGQLQEEDIDAKGRGVKGNLLFGEEEIGLWLGILSTHVMETQAKTIDGLADLQLLVRRHWQRGIKLLHDDWTDADGDYDKFIDILVTRRAALPETAASGAGLGMVENPISPSNAPEDISALVQRALRDIGVTAEVRGVTHGPRISRYKIFLNDVNQLDKLKRGTEKLAVSLNLQESGVLVVRGVEPRTVGLDLPRPRDTWQSLSASVLREWAHEKLPNVSRLTTWPGVDAMGTKYALDLAAAPHLLVAGTTGSGKSICLHALILALLWANTSKDVQLALIDPKSVEFVHYHDLPHLYQSQVSTTLDEARDTISELVVEMEARYQTLKSLNVQNIDEARKVGQQLPYIVVVIEEFADLIMQDKALESQVIKLAQKARASGIHLILATQRPDASTFSGLIRSNIPARIALTVQKSTESKIILDDTGAERLLGRGDMLIKPVPGAVPERVHGLWVRLGDIHDCIRAVRSREA